MKDFAGLEVAKLLEVQDRARLSVLVDRYRHYTTGEICEVEFQDRAVQNAMKPASDICALEIATGGGKTVIAARVAKEHVIAGGRAVYICPNAAALGSEISGIIQIFHRVFSHYKVHARIGQVNVPSKVNHVNFFTPMGLLGLRKINFAFFDQLLDLSSVILVDEAHHFPEDDNGALKIFGEVPRIAKERFYDRGKKVVAFTATYGRLDGKTVVGKAPGFRFTIKNSVDEGRAPEVHGMQIYLPFKCPNARTIASDVDLRLDEHDYVSYWRLIAGYMTEIWKRRPVPLAAFVRLRSEAEYLVKLFNAASGLGGRGLAALTSDIPMAEREKVINAVKDGSLIGYVTCGVGVESIDIPRLEVIHLIQRTKSINKIVQAVGRALRPWKGKPRALVVDYQVLKESVINGCNGILLYAQGAGVDPTKVKKRANGSAIVAIDGAPTTIIPDKATFGECEDWVIRSVKGEVGHVERLLRLATTGAERPKESTLGEWEGFSMRVLAFAFYRLRDKNHKEYDRTFIQRLRKIENVHLSWIFKRGEDMTERKNEILRRATAGEQEPRWNSHDHDLAFCLYYWTKKRDPRYDADFTEKLLRLRPDWFGEPIPTKPNVIVKPDLDPRISRYAPSPPMEYHAPAPDHWLSTRIFIQQDSTRLEKGTLQSIIMDFVRSGGEFPEHCTPNNPYCYFVDGWVTVPSTLFAGRIKDLPSGDVSGPKVWYLQQFMSDISDFTDKESTTSARGRRLYDQSFSWWMKFKKPDLKFLKSAFTLRDRAISHMLLGPREYTQVCPGYGLTRFELLVKEREKKVLSSIGDMDFDSLVRELELFYLVDGEFPKHFNPEDEAVILSSRESCIRYRDAQHCARLEHVDAYGETRHSPVETAVNHVVYSGLLRKLEAREISSSQWADLDEALQEVLCGERKELPAGLLPFSDVLRKITTIEDLRNDRRNMVVTSYEGTFTKSEHRRGMNRPDVVKLLWIAKVNPRGRLLVDRVVPGAIAKPDLMLRKTNDVARLEGLCVQNKRLQSLMESARAGDPFPEGLSQELESAVDYYFELFLYDERIDWLRKLEDERKRYAGLAVQAAP